MQNWIDEAIHKKVDMESKESGKTGKPSPGREKRVVKASSIFSLKTVPRTDDKLVRSAGKQSRGNTSQQVIFLPNDLKKKIESRGFGPNSSAIIGLVQFALDELEKQEKTLEIEVS
jgi:hypothetical protein